MVDSKNLNLDIVEIKGENSYHRFWEYLDGTIGVAKKYWGNGRINFYDENRWCTEAKPNGLDYDIILALDNKKTKQSGKVKGYCFHGKLPTNNDIHNLLWVAVDPSVQGKGYGKKFLDIVEEAAKDTKGILLDAAIPEHDEESKNSYEWYMHHGFVDVDAEMYLFDHSCPMKLLFKSSKCFGNEKVTDEEIQEIKDEFLSETKKLKKDFLELYDKEELGKQWYTMSQNIDKKERKKYRKEKGIKIKKWQYVKDWASNWLLPDEIPPELINPHIPGY